MDYELEYDEERHLILGHVHGVFDTAVVRRMAVDLAEMVREHECFRLLNDLRDATITGSTPDIYEMPRTVRDVGVPVRCRRALIVREPVDDFRFLETTSVNVGQQVRVFTDPDEALEWLTAGPAVDPGPTTGT